MIGHLPFKTSTILNDEHAQHLFRTETRVPRMFHRWTLLIRSYLECDLVCFCLDSPSEEVKCGCKRLRREHSFEVMNGGKTEWKPEKHTQAARNNAYGRMRTANRSYYIRCDLQTKTETLVSLMLELWKMRTPQLIICIIGGAKHFKLNERLEREFIKGIIQAVLKAGRSCDRCHPVDVAHCIE
jgi:hypothetical protein